MHREQKWFQFDRAVSRTVSHCYRTTVKRSLASSSIGGGGGGEPVLSLPFWYKLGQLRETALRNLKDAFYSGTRRTRNRKCVLHLSSPHGRFIVQRALERRIGRCFCWFYQEKASFVIILWNFHGRRDAATRPPSRSRMRECNQRFLEFIIDLHANRSRIASTWFLAVKRFWGCRIRCRGLIGILFFWSMQWGCFLASSRLVHDTVLSLVKRDLVSCLLFYDVNSTVLFSCT